MPYLQNHELTSHLHEEVMEEIDRQDDSKLTTAIAAAISEMRGYLSFYDVTVILATTGTNREPILLLYTKDIAVWHFIQLANPNVDMELRKVRYDRAIQWLKDVQKGIIVPNLPILTNADETVQTGKIKFGSNKQRNTHF
jgi:phage gp36-like protein